ncbi:hypothetical protein CPC08DRAFT_210402 [Agrocybe pediades]|nr:hypothetical protein CPC08DRAFT_210402 [Agrocybe pediades]
MSCTNIRKKTDQIVHPCLSFLPSCCMAPIRTRDIATPSDSHHRPYLSTARRRPAENALQKDDEFDMPPMDGLVELPRSLVELFGWYLKVPLLCKKDKSEAAIGLNRKHFCRRCWVITFALKVIDFYKCSAGARELNRMYLNSQFCPTCMDEHRPANLIPAPPFTSYSVVHRLPMGEVDTRNKYLSAHSGNATYASPSSGMPACQDGMPGVHQSICQTSGCGICAIIAQGPCTYTPPAWMQDRWAGELYAISTDITSS